MTQQRKAFRQHQQRGRRGSWRGGAGRRGQLLASLVASLRLPINALHMAGVVQGAGLGKPYAPHDVLRAAWRVALVAEEFVPVAGAQQDEARAGLQVA